MTLYMVYQIHRQVGQAWLVIFYFPSSSTPHRAHFFSLSLLEKLDQACKKTKFKNKKLTISKSNRMGSKPGTNRCQEVPQGQS